MSNEGGEQQELQQSGTKAGQDLPWVSIGLMLVSGLVLVLCFGLLKALELEMDVRTALLSLVVASCVLASFLLTLDDSDESRKAVPFLGSGLIAFLAAFMSVLGQDNDLKVLALAFLAMLPLLVAFVGPRMSELCQLWREICFSALGVLMYGGAFLAAAILSVAPEGSFREQLLQNTGIILPALIGAFGISGVAIVCGVYLGVLVKLFGAKTPRP